MKKLNQNQQDMTEQNMRLAYKIAYDFHDCGIELEELQSIALLGLVKAASCFEEERDIKFATYASAIMKNDIKMEIRKSKQRRNTISLDSSQNSKNQQDIESEYPYYESGYDDFEDRETICMLLSQLKSIERKSIVYTLIDGMSQKEAAEKTGVSQSYISRQVISGINKMRENYFSKCV